MKDLGKGAKAEGEEHVARSFIMKKGWVWKVRKDKEKGFNSYLV